MTRWEICSEVAEQVLRAAGGTAQEYDGHLRRIEAALTDLLGALPHSPLVAASLEELAATFIRPQVQAVASLTTTALQSTQCAVSAYLDADAQMARHSAQALPAPEPRRR